MTSSRTSYSAWLGESSSFHVPYLPLLRLCSFHSLLPSDDIPVVSLWISISVDRCLISTDEKIKIAFGRGTSPSSSTEGSPSTVKSSRRPCAPTTTNQSRRASTSTTTRQHLASTLASLLWFSRVACFLATMLSSKPTPTERRQRLFSISREPSSMLRGSCRSGERSGLLRFKRRRVSSIPSSASLKYPKLTFPLLIIYLR